MALKNDKGMLIIYQCSDLIEELKSDMLEFGSDLELYVVFETKEGVDVLVDYYYADDTNTSDIECDEEHEYYCKMSCKEALSYLELQNKPI